MAEYYPRLWMGHLEVQFNDETNEDFEVRMADKHRDRPPRLSHREVRDSMTLREYLRANLAPRSQEYIKQVQEEAEEVVLEHLRAEHDCQLEEPA